MGHTQGQGSKLHACDLAGISQSAPNYMHKPICVNPNGQRPQANWHDPTNLTQRHVPPNMHEHVWCMSSRRYLPSGTVGSSRYPCFLPRPRYCPMTTSSMLIGLMFRSTFTFSFLMSSASRLTCHTSAHLLSCCAQETVRDVQSGLSMCAPPLHEPSVHCTQH